MCCFLSSHRQKTQILQKSYCFAPANEGLPQDITESPPTGCRNKELAGHVETFMKPHLVSAAALRGTTQLLISLQSRSPCVQNTCVDRMLNGNASRQYESQSIFVLFFIGSFLCPPYVTEYFLQVPLFWSGIFFITHIVSTAAYRNRFKKSNIFMLKQVMTQRALCSFLRVLFSTIVFLFKKLQPTFLQTIGL